MRNSIKDNVGSPIGNLDLVTIRNVRLMISCFYFDSLMIGILTSSSATINQSFSPDVFHKATKNFRFAVSLFCRYVLRALAFEGLENQAFFCLFQAAVFCETLGFFTGFCEASDAAGLLSSSSARNGVSGGETE